MANDTNNPDKHSFFDQFAEPIDLSNGEPVTIPALKHPAALMLAGEAVLILPEGDTPAPGLSDYKVVAVGGLTKHMGDVEARQQEWWDQEFDQKGFLHAVNDLDRSFEEEGHKLPPGVVILRPGEHVFLGRDVTQDMEFPEHVSRYHADVLSGDDGITIRDAGSSNGTLLYLSPEDAAQEKPEKREERYISDELRDQLYMAYMDLCDEKGNISVKSEDGRLVVSGGDIQVGPNGEKGIELYIRKSLDFPDLNPSEGYEYRKLDIDPLLKGINVIDSPDRLFPGSGASKIFKEAQLTEREAQQALDLAASLSA